MSWLLLNLIRSPWLWAQNAHLFSAYAIVLTPWAIWRSTKGIWAAAIVMTVWAVWKEVWFDKYVEHPGPHSESDWDDLGFYLLGIALALVAYYFTR